MPVFGQLGRMDAGSYRPKHFEWREFISADEYQEKLEGCRLLVAHAGMGSIISALTWGKPLLMMARRASLGEHRNEHQLATAAKFGARAGIHVAADAGEVGGMIDRLLAEEAAAAEGGLSSEASHDLISALKQFIHRHI